MKRSKRLIVLTAVLALVCIASVAVSRYEKKQEDIKSIAAVILELPVDSVSALSWSQADDGLGFYKAEGKWTYEEDAAFPVDNEKIEEILSHFESFGASFVIEDVEEYGQYGLDDPAATVIIETDTEVHTVKLGDFSKMDQQRYVDIGDGNVYLVNEDPLDFIAGALSELIKHDETPIFESTEKISFTGSEDYSIVKIEDSGYTYSDEDIYFAQLGGENLAVDTEDIIEYLNTVTSLELFDYATYNAYTEELSDYGLDNPELSVSIDYSYTDENEEMVSDNFVFHIGRNPEEQAAYDEAEANEEIELPDVTKYIRIGDSQIIYELDDLSHITLSNAGYDDLRHRELIWAEEDKIIGIEVQLDGEEYSFVSELEDKSDDAERKWFYNDEETDMSRVLAKLCALSADSFSDERADGKEEISLTVHLEDENFSEVEVSIYRYDGSLCLAEVDGKTVSLIDRAEVIDFIEAIREIVLN